MQFIVTWNVDTSTTVSNATHLRAELMLVTALKSVHVEKVKNT